MIERRKTQQDVVNWTGMMIAIMLTIIFAFVTYALVRWTIPTENENAVMLLLGHLNGLITAIVMFYFGSSSSAKKKDDTIDTLAKTAQTAGAALPAALSPDTVAIPPGGSATTTAVPGGGTVIKTDSPGPE